jgi:hypothetical protein
MSREQVVDQTAQQDQASSQSTATEETYGLPAALYAQVTRLGPGNVEGLKELLARYPDFRQGILSVASHHLGASTVRQAMSAGTLTQDQIRPGGEFELEGGPPRKMLTQDQIRPGGEFELEGGPPRKMLTQDQIRPGGEFELEGNTPAPAPTAPEPGWVAGARKYNDAHADLVSNFNALTGNSCIGADGKVDPQLVADWQRARGLEGDGKIGPLTLAAARQGTEARIPV